jgi:hypothetical protein
MDSNPSPARQADLKRQYRLAMPAMGIYAIRNTRTGRILLDGSRNIPGALNRHRFELRQGVHRNKSLLLDWKTFGESSFVFETLDAIAQNADPAFDYDAELRVLLELWRERHPCGAADSYH